MAVESLRTKIEEALNKLVLHRRPADFQRLAFHVASLTWPDLRATTLVSDLGADALIPFHDGKTKLVLACGIDGDLTKLKEDCQRLRSTHPELEEIVFATTRPVKETTESKWREEIRREFGIGLRDVIQREWITSELEKPPNRWLCKDYLEIPLPEFESLADALPRIRRAAAKLLNAWKDEHQFERDPLIDLSLEELGMKGPSAAVRLSAFARRLSAGDRCWINGVPGAGKTFSLLTIASTLTEPDSLIPIPVSLRDLSHQRRELLERIASEPSFQQEGINGLELANAASAGKLLILLNGWNEIPRDARMATIRVITSFTWQMPSCALLVTSRQPPENEFPARDFRIKPLSSNDIRETIRQSGIEDAGRHSDFILASGPLSEIAAVPLFLQAIIQEVKAGNELPLGKQAMLRRMVERAVEEHRLALAHGEVRDHAFRYLRDLAWKMTSMGSTTLSEKEARLMISSTARALKEEALLGESPAPPDILSQLRAGHLLLCTGANGVAFTHQLIQEHFAATWITSALNADRSGSAFPCEILDHYQWEEPLFLALEDLAEEKRSEEIRIVLEQFRFVDFEAACRMSAVANRFWAELKDLFAPVIRHLASLENVNAHWLAARYAAATGQVEFQDLVWVALAGHPKRNLDCFEKLPSALILRALGEGFGERLLRVEDEDFRFGALIVLGFSPSAESLKLAEHLAIHDPATMVRRLAFRQLLLAGRRDWLRRFLREAKQQGRPFGLLRLLSISPRCTTARIRKFLRYHFQRNIPSEERTKILDLWDELDAPGASAMARDVYDRLAELPPTAPGDLKFRYLCLKVGSKNDYEWAIPRVVWEALSPDGPSVWGSLPLNLLRDSERAKVVTQLLPELARRHDTTKEFVQRIAELAPVVAAECLLRAITENVRASAASEELRNLQDSLHSVSRAAVIEAVLRPEFAEPSPIELGPLICALGTRSPGGDPDSLQSVDEGQTLGAYRQRLLHWLSLLPEPDQESASDWATCATLISELKQPEDAGLLYELLKQDERRLCRRMDEWRQAHAAYIASGRSSTPPGPRDWSSYHNWYIAALANLPGERCMEIMIKLLTDPDYISVAAKTLAKNAGADPIDLLFDGIQSRPRFDLVYERRSVRKPVDELATRYETAIKAAIELHLSRNEPHVSQALFPAFHALVWLAGPDSEAWILKRLEQHYPDAGAESLLECMTLAGCLLSGQRILPFVRRTLTAIRNHQWTNHDRTYLLTKALVALFFSDSPQLAIQLLEVEATWFVKSYHMRALLGALAWERSAIVDAWLDRLLVHADEDTQMRGAILACQIERARRKGDHAAILGIATWMARNHAYIEQSVMASHAICELAGKDEGFRNQLLDRARGAHDFSEALGWNYILSDFGTVDALRVGLALAERFGERLGIVSGLAPHKQEGTSLTFHGWFYAGPRGLHCFSDIVANLHQFAASSDQLMSTAARQALLWIERVRILSGPPPYGPRAVPRELHAAASSNPWQLRLSRSGVVS